MGSKFSSIIELWESTQVELHGRYSEERTLQLATYATHSSWVRVIGVLVATPLPCLVVTVLVDILPLADPSEGLSANSMFILREYCSYLVMNFLASQQFRTSVPALPFPIQRVVRNTIVMSTLCAGVYYGFAVTIGFPVPFSIVMVMPAWVVIISTSIALEWAEKIRQTPGTGRMVLNVVKVWMCEVLLVLIYPPFFYIFTILTESTQMAFALLLPVIKIFMRNVFMRTVVHLRDDLPEVVVFNVEVFNALFVSYCMQNSPSFWTTVELMLADIVLLVLSTRDIEMARRGLEELEGRIGARNTNSQTTLERVKAILQRVELSSQKSVRGPSFARIGPESTTAMKKSLVVMRVDAISTFAMAPQPLRAAKQLIGKGTVKPVVPQIAVSTKEAIKPPVGLSYTRKVRRLLFMTEFVLLLNYVEVVIPLVFSMYMFAMYHLPNRSYYAQLADLDEDQLLQTLNNVLFYCSLQLLSLLVLAFTLQRKLGLSPIRQLSFVLEKQFAGAQIKLIFWVFYNVQASLKHSGYDYTFQFNWLRRPSEEHRTSA